jgi:hypothetical protein
MKHSFSNTTESVEYRCSFLLRKAVAATILTKICLHSRQLAEKISCASLFLLCHNTTTESNLTIDQFKQRSKNANQIEGESALQCVSLAVRDSETVIDRGDLPRP